MDKTAHRRIRSIWATTLVAAVAAACAGSPPATEGPAPASAGSSGASSPGATIDPADHPISLRLAVADPEGRQSEAAVRFFVDKVAQLSGGGIEILPTFAAGDQTAAGFEEGVADLVKRGEVELALAGSRIWDLVGATSLQALHTPFLIDNDRLALAVAKDPIARTALDGMGEAGLEGLAMWPEDLRHLFAFDGCGKDFRTPRDIRGSTIVVLASGVNLRTIQALGGQAYTGTDRALDAASCVVHGMETGLMGVGLPATTAITAGNVVLFPKYQVLAGNGAAIATLTDAQRSILRQAATATATDAFTRQPAEADLAEAWCAAGGSVTVASGAQLASLVAAVEPVETELRQDPASDALIEAIVRLKVKTPASSSASPCGPQAADPGPLPDLSGYRDDALPSGTYRIALTETDLVSRGAAPHFATINAGTWTMVLSPGAWTATHRDGSANEECGGTIDVIDGYQRFVTDVDRGCAFDMFWGVVWRLDDDHLVIQNADYDGWTDREIIDASAAFVGRAWLRID